MDTLASTAAALPGRSNQRKVILAAVAASHSRGDVQEHTPIGKDLWKTSETNAAFLLHGHELETPTMTKQKYHKDVVEEPAMRSAEEPASALLHLRSCGGASHAARGAARQAQKRPRIPSGRHHLTQRAWPWGRGAARAASREPKINFAPYHTHTLSLSPPAGRNVALGPYSPD